MIPYLRSYDIQKWSYSSKLCENLHLDQCNLHKHFGLYLKICRLNERFVMDGHICAFRSRDVLM